MAVVIALIGLHRLRGCRSSRGCQHRGRAQHPQPHAGARLGTAAASPARGAGTGRVLLPNAVCQLETPRGDVMRFVRVTSTATWHFPSEESNKSIQLPVPHRVTAGWVWPHPCLEKVWLQKCKLQFLYFAFFVVFSCKKWVPAGGRAAALGWQWGH